MNRTSAKRGLNALFAMFLLVGGLLFVSNSVSAQSAPKLDITGVMWVAEQDALDILNATITSTHQQMSGMTPGTAPYNAGMRRAVFLKGIYAGVSTGTSVPNAVLNTFGQYQHGSITASAETASVYFSPAQAMAEANFAIDLLRTN